MLLCDRQGLVLLGGRVVYPRAMHHSKGSRQIRKLTRRLHRMLVLQCGDLLGKICRLSLKGEFLVACLFDSRGQGLGLCLEIPELCFGLKSLLLCRVLCGLCLGMRQNICPDLLPTVGKGLCRAK